MSEPLLLTLPYGPSINQFKAIFNNRLITSRDGRAYQKLVQDALRRAGVLPFDGDVEVKVDLFRPQKSGDLDNRLKPIFDCLTGFAYHDDDQIGGIIGRRHNDKVNPRVELEIKPLEAESLIFRDSLERNNYRKATASMVSAKAVLASGNVMAARAFIDEAMAALAFFPGVMSGGVVVVNAAEARAAASVAPTPPAPAAAPRPTAGRPRAWPSHKFDAPDPETTRST